MDGEGILYVELNCFGVVTAKMQLNSAIKEIFPPAAGISLFLQKLAVAVRLVPAVNKFALAFFLVFSVMNGLVKAVSLTVSPHSGLVYNTLWGFLFWAEIPDRLTVPGDL